MFVVPLKSSVRAEKGYLAIVRFPGRPTDASASGCRVYSGIRGRLFFEIGAEVFHCCAGGYA